MQSADDARWVVAIPMDVLWDGPGLHVRLVGYGGDVRRQVQDFLLASVPVISSPLAAKILET